MVKARELVRRVRRSFGIAPIPELDRRLAKKERVFHAPPLTPELVAAIKLISPHCDFTTAEKYRATWEADQNGACWGEYEALEPFFRVMPRAEKILEIGPGMGRSLVFFSKMLGWRDRDIHTYEGNGETTKYTMLGPRFEDSFCGNIKMLRYVLSHNDVHNVGIFNAQEIALAKLPGPYDFIYSFYSVGFHWALEHFLDDLLALMHDETLAVFTLTNDFTPFPRLQQLAYKIIDWKTVWPHDGHLKLLIVGKERVPDWPTGTANGTAYASDGVSFRRPAAVAGN